MRWAANKLSPRAIGRPKWSVRRQEVNAKSQLQADFVGSGRRVQLNQSKI